jgi:glutaredoxin
MKKKLSTISLIALGIILLLLGEFFLLRTYYCPTQKDTTESQGEEESSTKAFMLLIELEDTQGVVNFVDNLKQRDIPGLLLVGANYVEENCEVVKTLLDYHDIEIAGVDGSKPYWDVDYKEQSDRILEARKKIFECTGEEIRVFGSKYFAYDENTVKAAEDNGIEYVLARGTTGAKSTIYKPDEYNVKIFSVSNVESHNWGTGSLCDYSYWAREGIPSDFEDELFGALKHDKISPVSHTYIGGIKKSWNDVYLKFFDEADVEWLDLDEFGKVDLYMPFSEITTNREVQYDTPHPAVPLEEEGNLSNPCSVEDITESVSKSHPTDVNIGDDVVVIFHNSSGEMCLAALEFFDENNIYYVEHLNTDDDYADLLAQYKEHSPTSEGSSTSFGYLPMIFIGDKAYSGFNEDIGEEILETLR